MSQAIPLKEQIKQINILYIALFSGQIMIALVLIFIGTKEPVADSAAVSTVDSSMTLIAALISLTAIGLSFFLYNKRKIEGAGLKSGLESKLAHYRASFVLRAALIEGANLTAILFYFIEANLFYLILFAIGIAAFLYIRPSVKQIAEDYQLSGAEQSELQNALI